MTDQKLESNLMHSDKAKTQKTYTLDQDVIERVKEVAEGLKISSSALVNMQLRIALGMIDEDTAAYANSGIYRYWREQP